MASCFGQTRCVTSAETTTSDSVKFSDREQPLSPPLKMADAEQLRQTKKNAELNHRFNEEAQVIAALNQPNHQFTAAEINQLGEIVKEEINPHSLSALELLLTNYLPTLENSRQNAMKIIGIAQQALRETRPEMQSAALSKLAMYNMISAGAVLSYLSAPDARLRITAIKICGDQKITAAIPELQGIISTAQPMLKIRAAGAWAKISPFAEAREIIERYAMLEDAELATAALQELAIYSDERAVDFYFARLNSRWMAIQLAAARNLARLPEYIFTKTLHSRAQEEKQLLMARLMAANFIDRYYSRATDHSTAENALPFAACKTLITNGGENDLHLAFACWQRQPELANLPLLIMILEVSPKNLAEKISSLLVAIVNERADLTAAPDDFRLAASWQKWWFEQYRVLATTDQQALLLLPDGGTRVVNLRDVLDFSSRISTIQRGRGANGENGGKVEIALVDGRRILLPAAVND